MIIDTDNLTFKELMSLAQKKRWQEKTGEERKEHCRKMLKTRWDKTSKEERSAFASKIGSIKKKID